MEKLVGLALSRFLSTYIKDFSSQQFKDWSLNDLQFKEDVIQELAGIPPNFKLVNVSCNKIYTKIPWKNLGNEPIVFYADKLYIEIEEPLEIPVKESKPPSPPKTKGGSLGFIDRILDNIKFEVSELQLKIKTLGKDKGIKSPPCILIKVQDIKINSTNAGWEVVELSKVHKVNEKGEVIMFKQIEIGQFNLSLLLSESNEENRIQIFENFPLRIRTKTKKEYFRGPLINYSINIDILDEFNLSMHQQEFKALEDVLDSILECFGREIPKKETKHEEVKTLEKKVENVNQVTSPGKSTLWGRFTGIIGSYKNLYGSDSQDSKEDTQDISQEVNPVKEEIPDSPRSKHDQSTDENDDSDSEFFDCYEELEEVPEHKAILVNDSEDVPFSEFKINILKGQLNLYDYILNERKGIAALSFQSFSFHFIPDITEKFHTLIDFEPTKCQDFLRTENKLKSSKINISLQSYKVFTLNPGPERHPSYHNLIERIHHNSKEQMVVIDFVKTYHPTISGLSHRELSAFFDSMNITFDIILWEKIYRFFFSSDKGKKFEQYLSDNFDYLIQEALSDQVHFKVLSKEPIIIIPPYAGKYGSKPHLASKVSKMHSNSIIFKSVLQSELPNVFSKTLFTNKTFPFGDGDIKDCNDDDLIISKKFEMDIRDAWLEIMPTPESLSERVIESFDMQVYISRNELKNGITGRPHLDVSVNLSEVDFSMNQSQYSYLLSMWGEKLAWNPHQITEEMKETLKMEKLLMAASSGALHLSSQEILVEEQDEQEAGILLRVNICLARTQINFLELTGYDIIESKDTVTNEIVEQRVNKYETIAKIDFPHITAIFELQHERNVTKFIMPSFTMQSPRHETSPFSHILTTFDQREECVTVRLETYKTNPPMPSKMEVKLEAVQICWIYTTLARVVFFFSSDEIPPEFREEKVKAFIDSYSFDQSPSLGMDWSVEFNASELIMVETPDTPECSPLQLLSGKLSRKGISDKEIHYNFDGNTSFFTKMWRDQQFFRESLTKPFVMKVLYLYTYNDITNSWSTRIDLDVQKIFINISRNQLIMMQSILDHQLSDIRDVSSKRSNDNDKKEYKEITARVLYNSFVFHAESMKISLKENNEDFSTIFVKDFSYSTENWSDIWMMTIDAGDITVKPTKSTMNVNILQKRRLANKKGKIKIVDDFQIINEEEITSKLISICYINKQDDYKGPIDSTAPWKSRWNIEAEPIEVVYDSDLHTKFQNFFALIEEHKNLRKSYQTFQSEINRIYGEDGVDAEAIVKIIEKPEYKVQNNDFYGMAIHVIFKGPVFYFLENQENEVLTLLEFNVNRIRFGNDVNVIKRKIEGLTQYELNIKNARLLLHTLKATEEDKSIFDHIIQSHDLLYPTNFNIVANSKLIGASGTPFAHLKVSIDSLHAKISLNRYKMLFGVVNHYIENFLQRLNEQPSEVDETLGISAPKEKKKISIDKIIEVNIKTAKATIVSDYMEELDLIYVKLNDANICGSMYKNFTEISFGSNFAITLNNMNFLKREERFVERFSFNLKLKIDHSNQNNSNGYSIDYLEEYESQDLVIDIDHDENNEEEEQDSHDSLLSVEFVVLSEIRICMNKEILRQLLEISHLYAEGVTDKTSDLHSHYQYIILNNTEDNIVCKQANGKGKVKIPPSQENYFVFPDPRLPRNIEVQMSNWVKKNFSISVEEQSSELLTMHHKVNKNATRDFVVHTESKGLKRYITIFSTHFITNETDKILNIHTVNASSSLKETIGHYVVNPKEKVPIACSGDWNVEFEISFDEVWNHSKSLRIDKKQERCELKFYNIDAGGEMTLLMYTKSEHVNDQAFHVNIIFTPPLIIANICTTPLEYCFPSIYFVPDYDNIIDEEIDNNNQLGVIEALSEHPFYVDLESTYKVAFRLQSYDKWTPEISFAYDRVKSLETSRRNDQTEEDDRLLLNVSVTSRQEHLGKIITVTTPFLLVNCTDMLMFAKQPGSKKSFQIQPNQMIPFSWGKGSRQLMVNFGNTAWSNPIQITDDSFHRIEVEIPDANLQYMFLMETKMINEHIKVICWNSWLNIRNLTSLDLKLIMNYEELSSDSEDNSVFSLNGVVQSNNIVIPKNSSTKSNLCPTIIGLTLATDQWHTELLSIDDPKKNIIQLRSKLNQESIALDIEVTTEEDGLFLTVKENKDPPYIIYNNTPFGLNFKRLKTNPSSVGKIEINSDKLQEYLDSKNKIASEIFYIGSHDSINMFDADQLDQGEETHYQVSIFIPDDEIGPGKENTDSSENDSTDRSMDYMKHRRNISTSSRGSDGLFPPENVHRHRRNFSTTTTGSDDVFNIMQKGNLKQTRKIAHFKQYFSSDREIWSDIFTFDHAKSGFLVNFNKAMYDDEDYVNDNPDALNKLHVSLRPQGKTISLTFSLPELDSGTVVAQESQSILLTITIPFVEIVLEDEIHRNAMVSLNIMGLHAEYSKYSSTVQYFYLVFQDLEVDTLFPTAEYPVLFIIDKSELHNYEPNILEVLFEWNVRDSRIFAEYIGLRVLPFILQLDGDVLGLLKEFSDMFLPAVAESDEIAYMNDPTHKERSAILNLLKKYTEFQQEQFIVEEEHQGEKNIFVGKFEIFPNKLTLSVGTNNLHFPVISEAHISLDSFIRLFIHDSPYRLSRSLGKYYMSLIWAEIYKIIGNIDAIASPVQNLLKIKNGVADFFILPFESLVLDDTPGSFLIGFIRGTSSLLINTTDFMLTTLMKIASSFSWLLQVVSLDKQYQLKKLNASRNHPTNIIYGFGHGFYELGYSIFAGVTGIVLLPYKDFKNRRVVGLIIGLGKGVIGILVKPVGGVFDFLSKSSEGALQTLGRGYIIQKQSLERQKGFM